jgi:hypothetical protein
VNLTDCIADCWFRLGFQSAAELAATGAWVTVAELNRFADDAVKHLSRMTALFLTYDNSITIVGLTAAYALPAPHVYTESAWIDGAQQLRITGVATLFALDQAYGLTLGPPKRVSFDAAGAGFAVLYPVPTGGGTLAQIMLALPADSASTLPVPLVLQDYFSDAMIAGGRSKESDNAMPEVSEHLKERLKMYETVFRQYWGPGR